MKITLGIVFSIAFFLIIGCTISHDTNSPAKQEQFYRISSLIDYNNSLCEGTGYSYMPNGFNSGIRVLLKDNLTKESILGYATSLTKNGGGSIGSEGYSCEEGIDSEEVVIFAYAKGYTPLGINFKYPKNKLATVEISMVKSCTSGPGFFNNVELAAQLKGNQTLIDEQLNETKRKISDIIQAQFGLNQDEYTLQCIEGNDGRGGFIKVKGTYKDRTPFELFYHWGWCSSGGSDCGYSKCIGSTSDSLFEYVKEKTCNNIYSAQSHDEYVCTSEAYDNSTEVQNGCKLGDFEKIDGAKKQYPLSKIQTDAVLLLLLENLIAWRTRSYKSKL